MSNHELYNKLVELVLAMAQSNRVVSKITDEQLRAILSKLTSRPEPSLEIKHK
jgi:DNA-binding TFAR19-related protein (PDSD5 family)